MVKTLNVIHDIHVGFCFIFLPVSGYYTNYIPISKQAVLKYSSLSHACTLTRHSDYNVIPM